MESHRKIGEIQKDLREAKKEFRSIVNAAGDDMGCDGSREIAEGAQSWVKTYERELDEARAARKAKKGEKS